MNTLNELREHLFDTLKALRNKEEPMDLDRAKVVSDVAQCLINTAKVEIDYMRVSGKSGTKFMDENDVDRNIQRPGVPYVESTGNGTKTVTHLANGTTVTRHRMGG